jgi:dTDP-4-dehydrorhamnose 3,5-epimerase and related enzymes
MKIIVSESNIPDVKWLNFFRASDNRGTFVKTFAMDSLKAQGVYFELKESFYSHSVQHVIRGLHFHAPPFDHDKIVFCIHGEIVDLALDIRAHSSTYGEYVSGILSGDNYKAMYIPKGFAHGFKTLSAQATVYYLVSGEHHADSDKGIRYDSIGFDWQVEHPILSDRDLSVGNMARFSNAGFYKHFLYENCSHRCIGLGRW